MNDETTDVRIDKFMLARPIAASPASYMSKHTL